MKKQTVICFVALILALSLTACSDSSSGEIKDEQETTMQEEESEEEMQEEAETEYQWDAGDLAEYGLSRSELLSICNEYTELISNDIVLDMDLDEEVEYENQCAEQVAEGYGLAGEDVDYIYRTVMVMPNYFATFDVNDVNLKYGELKYILVNSDGVIVINAKITPSYSNEATIDQNYFTVCDFIRKYIGDADYKELQYWAVADMTDGSESKCISFTVPQNVIEWIGTRDFIDTQLGDYADDLWILPSLLD